MRFDDVGQQEHLTRQQTAYLARSTATKRQGIGARTHCLQMLGIVTAPY